MNTLLKLCKKKKGGMSQGQRKRRRKEVKTPQADPKASTEGHQMQRLRGSDLRPVEILHQFPYQPSLGGGTKILLSPSESPFVEHSTHPKSLCPFFTFWVPLDPLHCLFFLQYETNTCAYFSCFMFDFSKVFLNIQQRIILTIKGYLTTT
jgi:hypothetical protein